MLRDYQQKVIELARKEFCSGKKAVLLVMPTGAG
jgi:superfamily II DNA or RNA helicase